MIKYVEKNGRVSEGETKGRRRKLMMMYLTKGREKGNEGEIEGNEENYEGAIRKVRVTQGRGEKGEYEVK